MRKLKSILATTVMLAFVAATGLPVQAQQYSGRSRAAAMDYQRALEAQRQLYYQQEQTYDNYAWWLQKSRQTGDLAGAAGAAVGSGGSLSAFGWGMASDQAISRGVDYGAQQVFSAPPIQRYNNYFWGYGD